LVSAFEAFRKASAKLHQNIKINERKKKMRKNNIEGLVAYGKDDDSDGDMIETNLSDEEVSKVEAGMKIQSELADIKYHLRSPRKSYRGTGKVNKYSGRGKEKGKEE